jgi:hypothetical protein
METSVQNTLFKMCDANLWCSSIVHLKDYAKIIKRDIFYFFVRRNFCIVAAFNHFCGANAFQLCKQLPAFMKSRISFPYSKEPATRHYPEPAEINPLPHIHATSV